MLHMIVFPMQFKKFSNSFDENCRTNIMFRYLMVNLILYETVGAPCFEDSMLTFGALCFEIQYFTFGAICFENLIFTFGAFC